MKTWTIFYKLKFGKFDKFIGKESSNVIHTATVEAHDKRGAERKFNASRLSIVRGLTVKGKTPKHFVRSMAVIVKVFSGDGTPKKVTVVPSRKPRWMR